MGAEPLSRWRPEPSPRFSLPLVLLAGSRAAFTAPGLHRGLELRHAAVQPYSARLRQALGTRRAAPRRLSGSPQCRGAALGSLPQVSPVAMVPLCRRCSGGDLHFVIHGVFNGVSTSGCTCSLSARGKGRSPGHLLSEQHPPALSRSHRAGECGRCRSTLLGVTHRCCVCPKPSGTVGPGFTPQFTGVIQRMLCNFIMFRHKFLPVFSLQQVHLGSGRFLDTCSSEQ